MRRFDSPYKGFVQQKPRLEKCGGVLAGEWSEANDLAVAEAEPPTWRRSVNSPVVRRNPRTTKHILYLHFCF
jgi:hypothetical protein